MPTLRSWKFNYTFTWISPSKSHYLEDKIKQRRAEFWNKCTGWKLNLLLQKTVILLQLTTAGRVVGKWIPIADWPPTQMPTSDWLKHSPVGAARRFNALLYSSYVLSLFQLTGEWEKTVMYLKAYLSTPCGLSQFAHKTKRNSNIWPKFRRNQIKNQKLLKEA